MIACGPIQRNLLKLAILFVATSAVAQAPPKYDPTAETKLKAIVQELKFVPPNGAKAMAQLVVKSGEETVQVLLCPKSFFDLMGVALKPSDEVQITGAKIKQDGSDVILARQVVKGDDTLTLRFNDGKPAW